MASTLKKRASRGGDAVSSPWAAVPSSDKPVPVRRTHPTESDDAPPADESAWSAVASVWRKLTDDTGAVEAAVVDKVSW